MEQFLWGVAAGSIIGFVVMFFLIARIAHRANQRAAKANEGKRSDRERLAIARRYLGQIATRESINEARKIANKAIKETGDDNDR